jgi:hypothetical protein
LQISLAQNLDHNIDPRTWNEDEADVSGVDDDDDVDDEEVEEKAVVRK